MSEHITGTLTTAGDSGEQSTSNVPLARVVIVTPKDSLAAVRSLPMYEDVTVIKTSELESLRAEVAMLRAKYEAFCDPARLHAYCVRHLTEAQVAHLFGERVTAIVNENAALRAALNDTVQALGKGWLPVDIEEKARAALAGKETKP